MKSPVQLTEPVSKHTTEQNSHHCRAARVLNIELSRALPVLSALDEQTHKRYQRAYCLIRLHGQPMGTLEIAFHDNTLLQPEQYLPQIWWHLHEPINRHLQEDGLGTIASLKETGLQSEVLPACQLERTQMLANAPFISVIVPTHQRVRQLEKCLKSLRELHYPAYEILIVDNAPTNTEVLELVQHWQRSTPQLHYLCEERPGVSWARNRGIQEAKGELLAFTDDDAIVDPEWLTELAFTYYKHKGAACVTGMMMPLELETEAQLLFEEYGASPRGCKQQLYNMREHHPRTPFFPYVAGSFGAGANMSFTASCIRHIQGFDPHLGGNGPSRNGQDIDAFFRVIINGSTLIYTPSAIIYHQHRSDMAGLQKQLYNFGVGFTAYLTKNLYERPHLLLDFSTKLPRGLLRLLRFRLQKNGGKGFLYLNELTKLEQKGMLYGPIAYFQTRHRTRL